MSGRFGARLWGQLACRLCRGAFRRMGRACETHAVIGDGYRFARRHPTGRCVGGGVGGGTVISHPRIAPEFPAQPAGQLLLRDRHGARRRLPVTAGRFLPPASTCFRPIAEPGMPGLAWRKSVAPGSSEGHFAEAQTPLASDSERPLVSGARKYETTKPTAVMAAMISIVAPSP